METLYNIMLYGGLALAILFAIIAVILFFKLKVPKAIGIVTGSAARKQIKEIREKGYESVQGAGASKQEAIKQKTSKISVRDVKTSARNTEEGMTGYEKAVENTESRPNALHSRDMNGESAANALSDMDSETATDVLNNMDGETATDILTADDDEAATDVLTADDDEMATDVLTADDDETATDVLTADDDEAATDVLTADDDEMATDVLTADDDETATDVLTADDEQATDVLRSGDNEPETDILRPDGHTAQLNSHSAAQTGGVRIKVLKDIVVVHTNEGI